MGTRMKTAARAIGALGVAGLAALGATYWLTYEPAPRIRVRWADGVTTPQRMSLEQKYLLLNPRDQLSSGSLAYDLLDTSTANIQALVLDPAIADTNDIDRNIFVVPFDVDYGGEWMWLGHRTPILRDPRIQTAIVAALALLTVGGLWADALHAWRALRRAVSSTGQC